MHTLSLSNLRTPKRWNQKGISSVVGSIFMVLIAAMLGSAYFFFTLSQNSNYNAAVLATNQANADRLNEKAVANVTAYSSGVNNVIVNGTLKNAGSLAVNIVTLWVVDSTNSSNFKSINNLNLNLNPGNITTLTGMNVPLIHNENDILTCWFVTSRGNTVSQYSLLIANAGSGNITNIYNNGGNNSFCNSSTYSEVSQGIGLISFDFKAFSHQDLITQPSSNNYLLSGLVKTYTLSQSDFVVMHVVLTNWDPAKQNMYILPGSAIYYVGSHSGTTKYNTWNLVNVTGSTSTGWYLNDGNQNPYSAMYVLPYGVPVDVFFGGVGNSGGSVDSNVYPLNVMVYGKLGTNDYGQNIPFVAAYIQ